MPTTPSARDGLHAKLAPNVALQFRVLAAIRNVSINAAMTVAVEGYIAAATPAERSACQVGLAALAGA